MNKVGILYSRIRQEEKLILQEAEKKGIELVKVNSRDLIMNGSNHY